MKRTMHRARIRSGAGHSREAMLERARLARSRFTFRDVEMFSFIDQVSSLRLFNKFWFDSLFSLKSARVSESTLVCALG